MRGIGLLVALGAAACAGAVADAPPGPASRTATPTAMRGEFVSELLLTGELEAERSIAVNSPQTAIFQLRIQFLAEEGASVRKGEPLLAFDNSALADRVLDLETQILDAETQLLAKQNEIDSALKDLEIEFAEKTYENDRTNILADIDPGILSRKELGDRQLAFQSAKRGLDETRERIQRTKERGLADLDVLRINRDKLRKDLQSAQRDMDLLTIGAPADGLVIYEKRDGTNAPYMEGDSCWPGQTIVRLPDLAAMQVAFFVNEVDARLLRVGLPVRIRLDSFPEEELTGEILRIPSMAVNRDDRSTVRIFKVVASLSETWRDRMKPGMSVQGRLIVDRRADVPLVARTTVRTDGRTYQARASQAADAAWVDIHPVARNAAWYVLDEAADAAAIATLGIPAASGDPAAALGQARSEP